MPFLLLLLLTLVCLVDPWPEPLLRLGPRDEPLTGLAGSSLLTWVTVLVQTGLAAALARWTTNRLRLFPEDRERTLKRHSQLRFYLLLGLLSAYLVILWVWGWGWAVQALGSSGAAGHLAAVPGLELLILTPLLAGLVLFWVCLYDADRAFHDTAPPTTRPDFFASRWAYVGFQLRQNLALILIPLFLLVLEKSLSRHWPGIHTYPLYSWIAMGVLLSVFVGLPWMLRLVLGLKPLPQGPLRDRLVAAARRFRFGHSNILQWDTRGVTANAMVAGILPFPRYVILTDKLVAELTPDEVEAVFGHEVGHIRHRHIFYYLVFLLLSLVALIGVWQVTPAVVQSLLGRTLPVEANMAPLEQALTASGMRVAPFVAFLGTYIFVVFGFLSRRCERQADLFGCRAVSCGREDCAGHYTEEDSLPRGNQLCITGIRTFISALEKVAYLNGISRDKPGWLQSWQHSTIARRVEFLQRVARNPGLEPCFQQKVFFVKLGLLLILGSIAAGTWLLMTGGEALSLKGWLSP